VLATEPLSIRRSREHAGYLDRGFRIVQRREQQLRLPVHRIGDAKLVGLRRLTSRIYSLDSLYLGCFWSIRQLSWDEYTEASTCFAL
jgi:hypothetical protein